MSIPARWHSRSLILAFAAALLATVASAQELERQTPQSAARLKSRIEETWRVVPIQDGLLLVPRKPLGNLKGVEVGAERLAIDGGPVTGADLIARLGPAVGEPVLQLSYLSPGDRVRLFEELPAPLGGTPGASGGTGRSAAAPGDIITRDEWVGRPSGSRVRIGGPIVVGEGEHVRDVVAVFGNIEMNGTASGNVIAVGGSVTLGPRAVVRGDLGAFGGRLHVAEGARVTGTVSEVGLHLPDFRVSVGDDEQVTVRITPDWARIARVQWVLALIAAAVVGILAIFTVVVAPGAVDVARRGSQPMFLAWLLGLGAQILFVPALLAVVALLTASVIGIPLLAAVPLLVLGFAVAALVGFTAVCVRLGAAGLPGRRYRPTSLAALIVGLVLVCGVGLTGHYLWLTSEDLFPLGIMLAVAGMVIEHTAWTIGLGAMVLAWVRRRQQEAPAAADDPLAVPS